jgi:hypothetical protein
LKTIEHALVLRDISLPEMSGIDLVETARTAGVVVGPSLVEHNAQ